MFSELRIMQVRDEDFVWFDCCSTEQPKPDLIPAPGWGWYCPICDRPEYAKRGRPDVMER